MDMEWIRYGGFNMYVTCYYIEYIYFVHATSIDSIENQGSA